MTREEFEHIASSLRDVMMSVGRNFFGNESDADDVAQEGLVALWKYCGRMESGAVHNALAVRIAKHCCMDMVRRRKGGMLLTEDQSTNISQHEMQMVQTPQDMMERQELHEAIDKAIGKLSPSERNLLL